MLAEWSKIWFGTLCRTMQEEAEMIYEIKDADKVKKLFYGWEETLIYSCIQQVMGKLYTVDSESPRSAMALLGDFSFFAGEPCRELVLSKRQGFIIMVPQNERWGKLIEECFQNRSKKVTRYAIKKNALFDVKHLRSLIAELPEGYELRFIDGDLYDICLKNEWSKDFVSVFESKEDYLKNGLGIVILKDGNIVSGASSYTYYNGGIEIEVDTIESERRRHLATVCSAALISECLKRGLYPSWDAQNMNSVRLAQKLGYEFSHEYTAYEVVD